MKKERTRNLLPAKIGFYGIIIFVGHFVFWHLAFALKVCLWNYSTLVSRIRDVSKPVAIAFQVTGFGNISIIHNIF